MLRKKYLPYSKPLSDLLERGLTPSNDVNVFIGTDALRKGKSFSISYPERTLALPAWKDPRHYYWPVNECSILIFDTGYADEDYLDDLVFHLFKNEATVVRGITPDFKLNIYHKE